jgi:hypothetical protein
MSTLKLLKTSNVYDIIYLKKKTSLIKKNININEFLVNKINKNKNSFFRLDKDNDLFESSNEFNHNFQLNKNLDLKNKLKLLFKNNRLFAKYFFNLKQYRVFSLNKSLKKISNFKKKDFIINLENNIVNILLKTDFFFSRSDCIWFLKNSFISVNSEVVKNENFLLKPYDVINLLNSKYYYFFYKNKFNFLLININKINKKF